MILLSILTVFFHKHCRRPISTIGDIVSEETSHRWILYQKQVFAQLPVLHKDLGSSVSIVSGYGLDDRAIEVRSAAEAKDFFSSNLCVQTGSGAHPASCTMGTGGSSPG
jgi:hypothetical protein